MSYLAEHLTRERNITDQRVLAGTIDLCLVQIWQAITAGDISISGGIVAYHRESRWNARMAELASLALADAGNDGEAFVAWLSDWIANGSWRERWEKWLEQIRSALSDKPTG